MLNLANTSDYRFGFVMEQNLGHVTRSQNLARWLRENPSIKTTWMEVFPDGKHLWSKVPIYTVRCSLRAQSLVRKTLRQQTLDCLLYDTQATALFSPRIVQRVPTVILSDATPMIFDTLAAAYDVIKPTGVIADLKFKWFRNMYQSATAMIALSDWVKNSLVQDYGVEPDKVTVILPGVELSEWRPTPKEVGGDGKLRLLFVGGDFARKGGHVLLEAFRSGLGDRCTLDIVTKDPTITSTASVRVHQNLPPNSPTLRQLYASSDLFVFPTQGDITPVVVLEAMASGVPVVATNVGALSEQVEDGVTGVLVPTNDPKAIVEAVCALADNRSSLAVMALASRARAERLFDAGKNHKAAIDVMKRCVEERRVTLRGAY
ncbi:MAG: glycosyltransferase family 4 protein [Cyanomargarita calcarea GSE-NOS-MK-12-04C]|jgi:glycosyltransferase involved in cell wall biosynthesis|uniref:Glycosyltransferase family 4 protein n=1 Tax=Cyanomargarita calcarea GSE-NOS-MK-12-04C TaxID=2839659 RepID=A0A951QN99_9CYAN|nr:glycosyltransferase family 4 protein [Cyanomargarita calcarea GSE-NOS-MK-12-04C]